MHTTGTAYKTKSVIVLFRLIKILHYLCRQKQTKTTKWRTILTDTLQ